MNYKIRRIANFKDKCQRCGLDPKGKLTLRYNFSDTGSGTNIASLYVNDEPLFIRTISGKGVHAQYFPKAFEVLK